MTDDDLTWVDYFAAWLAELDPRLRYLPPDGPAYDADDWGVIVGPFVGSPARQVSISTYGGRDSDSRLGWDEPSVQLRVRGASYEHVSRAMAQRLYDRCHGAGPFDLPDGTRVQLILGRQSGPTSLGENQAGQHEHTVNLAVSIRNSTEHRT